MRHPPGYEIRLREASLSSKCGQRTLIYRSDTQYVANTFPADRRQWAKALKLLDPTITLILCGETGLSDWDVDVLRDCLKPDPHAFGEKPTRSLIDMHSIHIYTASDDPVKNVFAPLSAERAIEMTASHIDLARISNVVPISVPRPLICFDEWNVRWTLSLLLQVVGKTLICHRYGIQSVPFQKTEQRKATLSPMLSQWRSGSTSSCDKVDIWEWRISRKASTLFHRS